MKRLILILAVFTAFVANSQVIEPIKWSFSSTSAGDEAELVFTAVMEKGWHLYDTELPEGGPIPTAFVFEDSTLFEFSGGLLKSPAPIETFDNTFQMNLRYFSDTAVFTQKVRLKDAASPIKGYVTFMGCDDEQCLPPNEIPFVFSFGEARGADLEATEEVVPATGGSGEPDRTCGCLS